MTVTKQDRMEIAQSDIEKHFDSLEKPILKKHDIDNIVHQHREFWRLSNTTAVNEIIAFLMENSKLRKVDLPFPSQPTTRYLWGEISLYELALSLRSNSYFNHYTAMYLHGLTEQIPKTLYVNSEQKAKWASTAKLEQSRIDRALKKAPRLSKNIVECEGMRICLLRGKNTSNLGVTQIEGPTGTFLHTTDVARTLIDIAVRPFYSGGVFEVLKAYRMAKAMFSVNELTAYLRKIGYIYPYHQVIGFYLDKAGVYKDTQIKLLAKIDKEFDFYLQYQMKDTAYSKKWRLYYPKGM